MITIPKPCHENWSDMTPKEKGRLCDKCCKVVVDFTSKTTSQIVDFFQASAGQKVCGRFRSEQVAVPVTVQPATRTSRHRLFMAALYLVFGSLLFTSCNNKRHEEVMGKMEVHGQQFTPVGDTAVKKKNPREGQQAKKECKPVVTPDIPEPLMGDVMYIPDTVNNKPINPQQ